MSFQNIFCLVNRFGKRLVFGAVLSTCFLEVYAQPALSKEMQVKAVYLYNFALFTEWPGDNADSTWVIGILGDDPFGPFLDAVVSEGSSGNQSIHVMRYASLEEIDDCHILFVCRDMTDKVEEILDWVFGRDILTISDMPHFTAKGGMVELFTEGGHVRFKVNRRACRAAGLTLSSRLLSLAIVE